MDEVTKLKSQLAWLQWGIEEIIRCTEPRAGSGATWICDIAMEAHSKAGLGPQAPAIQKPQQPV